MTTMTPVKNTPLQKNRLLVLCGIAFWGGVCFFVGRNSVRTEIVEREKIITVVQESMTAPVPVSNVTPANVDAKAGMTTAPSNSWDENRWHELTSQLGTVARNQMLAAVLEKLAVTDPQKAMGMAEAETNLKLRDELVQAVLRGWVTVAPMDAANWALALTNENQRNQSIATIFSSTVNTDPQSAMSIASQICRQNPEQAALYGSSFIQSLCHAGKFEMATQFAADGNTPSRPVWLIEAYSDWVKFQPAQAAQSVQAITDPDMHAEALRGLASGWSDIDPAGLAQFIMQLPSGESRGEMLGWALQNWAKVDPVAATGWITSNYRQIGGDMDSGFQSIATANALQPKVAVTWAEAITDPVRRSDALTVILQNWVHTDLTAAKQFFAATQNLLPPDREHISGIVNNDNLPTP